MSLRVTAPEINIREKITLIDDKLSFDQLLAQLKNCDQPVVIGNASQYKYTSESHGSGFYWQLNVIDSGRTGISIGSTQGEGALIALDGAGNGDLQGSDYFWIEHHNSGAATINLRSSVISNGSSHSHVTFLQDTDEVPGAVRTQYSFQMCDGGNKGTTMASGQTNGNDFMVTLTGLPQLNGTAHEIARVRVDYVSGELTQGNIYRWSREFIIEGVNAYSIWSGGNADMYGNSPAPSFVSSTDSSISVVFNTAGAANAYGCAFVTVSCPRGGAYITITP